MKITSDKPIHLSNAPLSQEDLKGKQLSRAIELLKRAPISPVYDSELYMERKRFLEEVEK